MRKFHKRFRNVILTGLPAVGKDVFGHMYAQYTDRYFIKLKDYIAKGQNHATHFKHREGNNAEKFEQLESRALLRLQNRNNCVIVVNSGSLCHSDNLQLAQNLGTIVWLQGNITDLAQRIFTKSDVASEPLQFKTIEEVEQYLKNMLEKYSPFYEKSDILLRTDFSSWDNLKFQLSAIEKRYFQNS